MKLICLSNKCKKHSSILLLVAVLLIQTLALGYIGASRGGLHIDEHYSYILSNSYDADRISNAPEVWNAWVDGNAFQEFLSVQKGEQFAYRTVYENNGKDAHPPLYYFLIHTICSLIPEFYSPWIGMGLNILLILLTQILLFRLGKKLTGSDLWAIVPVVIYGGMQIFADTVLFIRMYSLMTLLTVYLVDQHYRLITSERKYYRIIGCFVITFLGVFTQYYFAMIAFFLAAATCIFLLVRKEWKTLVLYAGAMLLAVVCVFVMYPAGIAQITGSETNNVGKEIANNLLNFSNWYTAMKSMLKQMDQGIFQGVKCWPWVTGALTLITVAVVAALRIFKGAEQETTAQKNCWYMTLAFLAIVVITVAVIVHTSGKFTYVRYIYNLFPLIALLFGMLLWLIAGSIKLNRQILAWGLIAVWLVGGGAVAKNTMCSYMFAERAVNDKAIVEHCEDKPLIVLNNGTTYQPTSVIHILIECDQVYIANYNNVESMEEILNQVDCSNGAVFLVLTDMYWSKGFNGTTVMTEITEQTDFFDGYSKLCKCDFSTAYVATPKN